MVEKITGLIFKDMVLFGAACVKNQQQEIDDLNVFPVPDGDTGTNMSLSIDQAAQELNKVTPATISEAAKITASGLLRGARGNSGVILSLIFRGMSKIFKEAKEADGIMLAHALSEGVSTAYNAVMKPAEGTVLTVSRLAAQRAVNAAKEKNNAEYVLDQAIQAGKETLDATIEMNPVLKKAGVVDAGGKGYIVILEGMLRALRGEPLPKVEQKEMRADFTKISDEDITYTFDTVFTIVRTSEKSIEPLRVYLSSIGDCLVIGEDDDSFKVHVHTDIPGVALTEAQKYGTLELAKIENMRMQHDDLMQGKETKKADDVEKEEIAKPEKKYGFISVCAGEGLAKAFKDLGVDRVCSGGQTMNPSTDAILSEVNKTPSEIVFVLPNNKNIIMAAQQCQPLTDKKVVVVPTTSVPQGITAMMNVDLSMEDAEALGEKMMQGASSVSTALITYAARDSEFDGAIIREGDYLALLDGKLLGTGKDLDELLTKVAEKAQQMGAEFINIYAGEGVLDDKVAHAENLISKTCKNAEVLAMSGGQPVYYYMISIE